MIKNTYLKGLWASVMLIAFTANAQSREEGVKQTILNLFEGMKKSDTALIRSAFAPSAIMQTLVKNREGKLSVRTEPVDSFVSFIAKPHKEIYDERISFSVVKIDADLAIAWTPYKFFIDDKFSHCGVNSFQLIKLDGNWKIQYIVDTRRRQNCEE